MPRSDRTLWRTLVFVSEAAHELEEHCTGLSLREQISQHARALHLLQRHSALHHQVAQELRGTTDMLRIIEGDWVER